MADEGMQNIYTADSNQAASDQATRKTSQWILTARFNDATLPNDTDQSELSTHLTQRAQHSHAIQHNQPNPLTSIWLKLQAIRLLIAISLLRIAVFLLKVATASSPTTQSTKVDITTRFDKPSVLRENEVRWAPMSKKHQDRMIIHIRRLNKIIYATTKRDIGRYTDRNIAIRQLARMTVVFHGYMRKYSLGEFKSDKGTNRLPESMLADIIDASFYIDTAARASGHPVISPINYDGDHEVEFGEEQEFERLAQEILADASKQAPELWLARTASTVVPILRDGSIKDYFGKDNDYDYYYAANSSDADIDYRYILYGADADLAMNESVFNEDFVPNIRERLPERFFPEEEQKRVERLAEKSDPRKTRKKVDLRWGHMPLMDVAVMENIDSGDSQL